MSFGLEDEYLSLLGEREKMAAGLSLLKQKELNVGLYSATSTSAGTSPMVEQMEDGTYTMHIKYDKYERRLKGGGGEMGGAREKRMDVHGIRLVGVLKDQSWEVVW